MPSLLRLCGEDTATGRCDLLAQFIRGSAGIVGADSVKEIDICVHLAGCGCNECYRLGFAVKFVAKYERAG
jgi:hypothetical protein